MHVKQETCFNDIDMRQVRRITPRFKYIPSVTWRLYNVASTLMQRCFKGACPLGCIQLKCSDSAWTNNAPSPTPPPPPTLLKLLKKPFNQCRHCWPFCQHFQSDLADNQSKQQLGVSPNSILEVESLTKCDHLITKRYPVPPKQQT